MPACERILCAFAPLVDPPAREVTADKGYDTDENHEHLQAQGQRSSIIVKRNRTNPQVLGQADSESQRERPCIERKFAEQKRYHGLRQARYWGLAMGIPHLLFLTVLACAPCLAQENLLANPSFELTTPDGGPQAWGVRAGERMELRTDGGRTGANYVRIFDPVPTAGVGVESARIPARPGGKYRASAWLRTGDVCQPGIYLNFYDDLGERVHHLFQRIPGPTDGWAQVSVETTAPDSAILVSTLIYGYGADVGDIDVDDVEMTVEGGKEPGSGRRIPPAETGEKSMVDIGDRRELFVDSYLVDGLSGDARRILHHPVPREVVLTFDKPWEGPYCGYFTVFEDEGKVRIYYRGWPDLSQGDCACMVESEDGINFTRPNLGLFDWAGSKDNNIVWRGEGCHNFTPFKDTNPAAPEDQRYKALASAGPKAQLVPFASPDGIHWRKLQDQPVITEGAFDSQNLAFFDSIRGEYVEYHRGFKDGVRDIMMSTSPDFLNWTKPIWLGYGDAPREHLYTNAIIPYFRAPHVYIGFPCRFVPDRKKLPTHAEDGINDGVLMSSRDGLNFERWVQAFVRPGPDPLRWTDRNNYPAWGMVATSDQEISIYWTEHYRYPSHRLRRGTLRTDGFVSVNGGGDGGEVLTRPVTFSGSRLEINYSTSAAGSIRIALCDESGASYEGFGLADAEMLFGDEITHTVKWRGSEDVSALAGKPVRLRVRLKDADLYSFRFAQVE